MKISNSKFALLAKHWGLIIVLVGVGSLTIWLSLARYHSFTSGAFDMGAMGQAIDSVSRGLPLVYTHKGVPISRLASHVELFYFLLAPLYALVPRLETLLIFQAVLVTLGAVPVYRLIYRHFQKISFALASALLYLFFPIAQSAVLFEFHGDTLAMPLLLFVIEAADRKAWREYGVWLVLALSCKFYVVVPVLAMGALLWSQGEKRIGRLTMAGSAMWGALAFFVIRSLFASPDPAGQVKSTAVGYISFYFGAIEQIQSTLPERLGIILLVCLPIILMGWRSFRWLIVASSILIPVALSTGPGPSYHYIYHHYALAVPFLLAAFMYGAISQMGRIHRQRGFGIYFSLAITLLLYSLALNTPFNPFYYLVPEVLADDYNPSQYVVTERDQFKTAWLQEVVPEDAPVGAERPSAYRLVNREILYVTDPLHRDFAALLPDLDWVVTDALFGEAAEEGEVSVEWPIVQLMLLQSDWSVVRADDGLLLFGRGDDGLTFDVQPVEGDVSIVREQFGDLMGLVDVQVEQSQRNHFVVQYDWVVLDDIAGEGQLLAVSRPGNLPHTRVVHLASTILISPNEWPANQLIRETVEIRLPDDIAPGRYPLFVSWYDATNQYAVFTDERSRIGDEVQVGWLEVAP